MRRRQDKEAALQEVVGLLYEAVVMPEEWNVALDRLYQLFDSMAAHFFLWDNALDQAVGSHVSTTYVGWQASLKRYMRINPALSLIAKGPVGSILLCHRHFDDAFVRRNEFYQECAIPSGRRFRMGTSLLEAGSTASIIELFRTARQGPFELADEALLERLRPHLQRVARMYGRLEQTRRESEIGRGLLDGVRTCLIATDATARIVRMNEAADAMLRASAGLRCVSGKLVAQSPAQTETLHRLIRQAVTTADGMATEGGGGMVIEGTSGERHGIMVMPLSRRSTVLGKPELPLALLAVSSLERRAGPDRHLMDMFGLTQSEAQLAAEFGAGKRLDVVAEERRVRMTTLRTQMRAIYSKTRTSRQAELVHLLANLPRRHGDT